MHTLLDLRGNIPSFIHVSDGKLHDVHALDLLLPGAWRGLRHGSRVFRLRSSVTRCTKRRVLCPRAKWNIDARGYIRRRRIGTAGVICDQTIVLGWLALCPSGLSSLPAAHSISTTPSRAGRWCFLLTSLRCRIDYLRALQKSLAGGAVLQMDQEHLRIKRFHAYVGECGQNADLDRRLGLCPRRHR